MSTFDLIAVALIVLTSLSGFRRGLVVGVFSLAGLAIGFYLGARVGPSLVGGDLARWLPLVALGGAMVCAAIGQAVGSLAGRHLRRLLVVLGPLRLFDNVGGGVLGAVTGLALCWAVGAVLLYLPRQTELRHYAQDSAILSRLNQELPPHRLIDTLAQIDPFATLAGPAAGVEPPDPAVLDSPGVSSAALSVVRVVGNACGLGIEGSGWIAGNGLVVTNAHVVAGVDAPHVDRNDGALLDAQIVSFDKTNDVAVLRVAGLHAPPLKLGDAALGNPRRAARLPGQRAVRRDGRPHRPHRADRRPRRVRQVPGQPQGDDDSRRHSQRQLGRAGRRCAGPT